MSNYCKTITDYAGQNGAMPLLYSIRDCIPLAFTGLLLAIFLILFAGQYYLIKNRTGRAKILIALLSSSFMMIILSMLMALAQLVTYMSVIFYAFVCIIVFILFQLSDNS
jgi:hypothetical protein